MLQRRYKAPSHRAEPILLPPNLRAFGVLSFTRGDREALGTWLAEGGWPRDRMDIATLEGYLVALLVWPVAVSSGAWLPPIWGERGWKVPAKMASAEAYAKFIGLVLGLLQDLDRGLSASRPYLRPTLSKPESAQRRRSPAGVSWAQGFLRGLQQSSQGLDGRSPAARSAVSRIARYASFAAAPTGADSAIAADLTSAVLTLAAERSSRGPLGALEASIPDRVAPAAILPASSRTALRRSV